MPSPCVQFFNFDNIFATSLLFNTLWATYMAGKIRDHSYLTFAALGLPLAAFLIVYCGMPASIGCSASGCRERKCLGVRYDFYHALWHLASGLGEALESRVGEEAISGSVPLRENLLPHPFSSCG